MDARKVRLVAADLLGVGESRVFVSPGALADVKSAMTRDDVRELIKKGLIKKKRLNSQSRGRARVLLEKKKKGRKRGKGKRKGTKSARIVKKENWIKNVRAQRRVLKELKSSGVELKESPRRIYLKIKGGYFKGKKYVQAMSAGEKNE